MLTPSALQGSASPDRAAVARAERERLKQQEMHKRQLLERMREEDNALVQQGEVSTWPQAPKTASRRHTDSLFCRMLEPTTGCSSCSDRLRCFSTLLLPALWRRQRSKYVNTIS